MVFIRKNEILDPINPMTAGKIMNRIKLTLSLENAVYLMPIIVKIVCSSIELAG